MSQHHRWLGPVRSFADRSLRAAVVRPSGTSRRHQSFVLENPVDRREGGLEQALVAGRDRQDAVGQIDVFLTLGHRDDPGDLFGQDPVQRLFGTGHPVVQSPAQAGPLLPADDPTMSDPEDRTTASGRHALLLGGLDHREDGKFGFRLDPQLGHRSHEPPFVFFRRIANSTARSARARSLSWSSRLIAS